MLENRTRFHAGGVVSCARAGLGRTGRRPRWRARHRHEQSERAARRHGSRSVRWLSRSATEAPSVSQSSLGSFVHRPAALRRGPPSRPGLTPQLQGSSPSLWRAAALAIDRSMPATGQRPGPRTPVEGRRHGRSTGCRGRCIASGAVACASEHNGPRRRRAARVLKRSDERDGGTIRATM